MMRIRLASVTQRGCNGDFARTSMSSYRLFENTARTRNAKWVKVRDGCRLLRAKKSRRARLPNAPHNSCVCVCVRASHVETLQRPADALFVRNLFDREKTTRSSSRRSDCVPGTGIPRVAIKSRVSDRMVETKFFFVFFFVPKKNGTVTENRRRDRRFFRVQR